MYVGNDVEFVFVVIVFGNFEIVVVMWCELYVGVW